MCMRMEALTSSMWSRNGICEFELHTPSPSMLMLTSTLVSFVCLVVEAALAAARAEVVSASCYSLIRAPHSIQFSDEI